MCSDFIGWLLRNGLGHLLWGCSFDFLNKPCHPLGSHMQVYMMPWGGQWQMPTPAILLHMSFNIASPLRNCASALVCSTVSGWLLLNVRIGQFVFPPQNTGITGPKPPHQRDTVGSVEVTRRTWWSWIVGRRAPRSGGRRSPTRGSTNGTAGSLGIHGMSVDGVGGVHPAS